ncbi:MAG: sugar transferase, partial [Myxococcota bacterium]
MLDTLKSAGYRIAKRGLDLVGGAAGLAATSPLWVPASIAVRLTMGSPIFFVQPRAGKDGEVFELIKFRTMREPEPGEDRL